MSSHRIERVAALIQQQLSYLIQHEINDPSLPKFITITAVKLSLDLSYAKVYFTLLTNTPKQVFDTQDSAQAGEINYVPQSSRTYKETQQDNNLQVASSLNEAAWFLRHALAKSIKLRQVPKLHFVYDNSVEYGRRLNNLIDLANKIDRTGSAY